MSDICCGVPVPPVPARPIDLNQPAYVLVDGNWVLLSEIIDGYLPPPPASNEVVLQMKHILVPNSALSSFTGIEAVIGGVNQIVPKSSTSNLLVTASVSLQIVGQSTQTLPNQTYFGFRRETAPGAIEGGSGWLSRSAMELEQFANQQVRSRFVENNFSPAERRSDGNWGVALYYRQNQAQLSGLVTDVHLIFTEYEPAA